MKITEMSYQELIAEAKEKGIENAHRTKKVDLMNLLMVQRRKEEHSSPTTTARRGRPVDVNSERQKRLSEIEARKAQGIEIKRGRPVNPESERQKRLAKVGTVKRGRPVLPTSERQKRLAEMEKKRAAGIEIKRGRPKVIVE